MNNITITIQAPELVEAMQALTVALQLGAVKPAAVEQVIEKLEEAKPKKAKADKQSPAPEPVTEVPETNVTVTNITLDDVRTALGNLAQAGKQAEVKTLIASFGATKLSEIPNEKYADLLAQAEALNG